MKTNTNSIRFCVLFNNGISHISKFQCVKETPCLELILRSQHIWGSTVFCWCRFWALCMSLTWGPMVEEEAAFFQQSRAQNLQLLAGRHNWCNWNFLSSGILVTDKDDGLKKVPREYILKKSLLINNKPFTEYYNKHFLEVYMQTTWIYKFAF